MKDDAQTRALLQPNAIAALVGAVLDAQGVRARRHARTETPVVRGGRFTLAHPRTRRREAGFTAKVGHEIDGGRELERLELCPFGGGESPEPWRPIRAMDALDLGRTGRRRIEQAAGRDLAASLVGFVRDGGREEGEGGVATLGSPSGLDP